MVEPDYKFKIIITGKNVVGKTSLIRRYVDDKFTNSYIPTLRTDFSVKDIHYKGKNVRLLLYELGGHKQYSVHQLRFFKGAHYICTLASLHEDERDSISQLPDILKGAIDSWIDNNEGDVVPTTVILNKLDLVQENDKSQHIQYKYKQTVTKLTECLMNNGIIFTSAKTGEGVDVLFSKIALHLLRKV